MKTVRGDSTEYVGYQPFLVKVKTPDGLEVNFNFFSAPMLRHTDDNERARELRGIANIEVIKVKNVVANSVQLQVYVTEEEYNTDQGGNTIHVWAIKLDGVKELGSGIKTDEPAPGWAGYIPIDFKIGDPPIAVG